MPFNGTASNSWNTIFRSGSYLLAPRELKATTADNPGLDSALVDDEEFEPQLLGPYDMWCSTDADDLRLLDVSTPERGWVFQEPPSLELPQLEPDDMWCSICVDDLRFLDVKLPDPPSRVHSCPSGFGFSPREHQPRGEVEEGDEEIEEMEEDIAQDDSHLSSMDSDSSLNVMGFFH